MNAIKNPAIPFRVELHIAMTIEYNSTYIVKCGGIGIQKNKSVDTYNQRL